MVVTLAGSLISMHVMFSVLLFASGRRLLGSDSCGVAAAVFSVLVPVFPIMMNSEYIYTANLLMVMCLATHHWAETEWAGKPAFSI